MMDDDKPNEPITVSGLIEKLKALPNQDWLVMIEGYEGGYEHASVIEVEPRVALNAYEDDESYMGPHEREADTRETATPDAIVPAYVLKRVS